MRARAPCWITAVLACLVVASPVVSGAAPELTVEIGPEGGTSLSGATEIVRAEDHVPGERYDWTLELEANHTVAEIRVDGTFSIDRPRQLVPLVDGKHFVELASRDVADVDQPANVFNLAGTRANLTYRLGMVGPGTVNLTLHTDTQPPGFSLGEPTRITHRGFLLRTTTDEPALATLNIHAVGEPEAQPRPTPSPALEQSFPVIGLEPETRYVVNVTFEDWSRNTVTSEDLTLETTAEPDRPTPKLTVLSPPSNATVLPRGVVVEVKILSPESPVRAAGVQMFFDKTLVPSDELRFEDGSVIYEPEGPLEPRRYSVSVEATNDAGGTGVARWTFTVEASSGGDPSPAPGLGWLPAIAVVSLGALVRSRHRN